MQGSHFLIVDQVNWPAEGLVAGILVKNGVNGVLCSDGECHEVQDGVTQVVGEAHVDMLVEQRQEGAELRVAQRDVRQAVAQFRLVAHVHVHARGQELEQECAVASRDQLAQGREQGEVFFQGELGLLRWFFILFLLNRCCCVH